ncbi:Coenzyme F420 hydrogenase/dehydrogenase, beta subunit C-terminal domain [Desulfotomaculum copahuensis]|uniref:4Fe-4S ferredoxin n=1 Tax=Desulfotomaculum copahuensis TaxID=1838280 RepID=A0A1B7LC21_9FIRM|nr:Coenzyme F420 hydrogenase/dehydrogenase, beta subunit C-terminal domain [Desulfotomaculum copahuensis]OAT80286.1 4Fe-4S ferredoxin [Desulfotomaculum copahuensis]
MPELAGAIQEAARKLLEEKKVDVVIGFAPGTLPLRSTPCFVHRPEDAAGLTWNRSCENNLANYLRKRTDKVAVVAKGCDSRSIIELIKENQINRENLVIIGVPCAGMIDRKKVDRRLAGKELLAAEESGDSIVLKGDGFTETIPVNELLHDSCLSCRHPNPALYDLLVGELLPEKGGDDFADVAAFEAKAPAERRAILTEEFSRCIRCYACRQACPMCYCEECFVDCSTPQWIGKSSDARDNMLFQAVRVLHSAGRCADCGACERACPMGLSLRNLTRKMVKDVQELFGYEAGANLEDKPALADFKAEDPQPFLIEE